MVGGLRLEDGGKRMNAYIFPFEKLQVYQLALDLSEKVLEELEKIPFAQGSVYEVVALNEIFKRSGAILQPLTS